jgi:hypothetical protein
MKSVITRESAFVADSLVLLIQDSFTLVDFGSNLLEIISSSLLCHRFVFLTLPDAATAFHHLHLDPSDE